MRKLKESKLQSSKGITLIALVITIIVLLILVGVTIASITGENGILSQATRAKEETEKATDREQRELAMLEASTNLGNTTYKGVTIPAGFAPTRIEGESTVDEGLVIIDSKGNEFVWIPCTLEEYQKSKNLVMTESWSHTKSYETNGGDEGDGTKWRDDYTTEDLENINAKYGEGATETISDITKKWENNQTTVAEDSIRKYNGFYIARYEAGIPKEATAFYTDKNGENLKYKKDGTGLRGATNKTGLDIIKDLVPVSKKGVQAWNFITQPNSKIVAENMYKGSSSVGSYLVDLQAWNHICKNIYEKNKDKSITNSSEWGNYLNNVSAYNKEIEGLWAQHVGTKEGEYAENYKKGQVTAKAGETNSELGEKNRIELPTGARDDFKNYNIYDMAGNMWEWTTGHNINSNNKTMFVVPRGR